MRPRLSAAALPAVLAIAACATVPPQQPAYANRTATVDGGRHYLSGLQCLDPAMARSWIDIDDRTILVDTGRYRYRIEVTPACSALDWSPVLRFRGDPISGRVCGSVGEAIVTRDYPCPIQDIQLLDKEQYKQALAERKASGKRRSGKVAKP